MTLDAQIKEFQDHARHSLQSGQPGPALALLTQANELQPDQPSTLMLQAISLSRLNQPVAANDAFRQALAITPDDAKLRFNFAVHLYSYGKRQEALDQVDIALSVNPDHAGSVDLAVGTGILGVIGAYAKGAPLRVISAEMTGATDFFSTSNASFMVCPCTLMVASQMPVSVSGRSAV